MDAIVFTAPVSRQLSVSDLAHSVAYYCDVLGFHTEHADEKSAALVQGPVRIELTTAGSAPDGTGQPQPRGQAMVFFETRDVDGLRRAIAARGGQPGLAQNVNWIKTRMFAVRDPDGHTLWFGQSLQQPSLERPAPMMRTIMPNLPWSDVPAGVAHYRDVLGFSVNYAQPDLAVLDRDDVRVLLVARGSVPAGNGSCYVYVRDADALHREFSTRGARVLGEPVSHPWGLRDFTVLDPEGNELIFGQTFE